MYLILAYKGRNLHVTDRTKPKDVVHALGQPTYEWNDEHEKHLAYESDGRAVRFLFCVQFFVFRREGKLKYVEIEYDNDCTK
jgi:hypothetical protein